MMDRCQHINEVPSNISRSTLEKTEILAHRPCFFLVAGPLIRQSFLNIFFLGILMEKSSSFIIYVHLLVLIGCAI
jgi:hypothetical protein